jgi:hypothetical protein
MSVYVKYRETTSLVQDFLPKGHAGLEGHRGISSKRVPSEGAENELVEILSKRTRIFLFSCVVLASLPALVGFNQRIHYYLMQKSDPYNNPGPYYGAAV